MDLKLGFCVLSLNLLILLVAYGSEARKMAEGKRLNFPVATEIVEGTNAHFWIYDNQGENGYHKTRKENAVVPSSLNKDLEHKDDIYFWIYNKRENNHQEAKKENVHHRIYDKQRENSHEDAKKDSSHIHSSSHNHMDHIDPSSIVFFLMDDLKLGKEINVDFPRRDLSSSSPPFLPKEDADAIPFSLKELPNLLRRFSFSQNSPQAKAMEDTLTQCEVPPIKGETKYCATSSEAMLDFVQGIMGEKIQFKALSTTHFTNSTSPLQKYTILDVPEEVSAPKMVACHTMPYAYAIFYCHYTISKSKVFKVSLGGENGDRVEATAVCHLDTSQWTPHHVSFRMLGILPGTSPVCHFFPSDHLVWVPKITTAADL